MKFSRASTQSGFTLVEVLVAAILLVFGVFALLSGFVSLGNLSKNTAITNTFDKQINEICSNIKAGIENYQVNFNFQNSSDQELLPVDKLPMVWDIEKAGTKEECPECQGTYGFTIRPLESMRGLYAVQVRFTHKSWGTNTKDVSFVVSVK